MSFFDRNRRWFALGLALLAGLAAAWTGGRLAGGDPLPTALNDGYHAAFWLAAALASITAVVAATQLRAPAPAPLPEVGGETTLDDRDLVIA